MWTLKTSQTLDKELLSEVENQYARFKSRADLGFMSTDSFQNSIDACNDMESFFENKFQIVVIGLGGSSLGTKAVCEALYPKSWQKKITFLDNVDSQTVDQFIEDLLNPAQVGWVMCSKSGSTLEVCTLFDYCHTAVLEKHNISIVENTIAITEDKKSPLHDFAMTNERPILCVPFDIGGRFSVFTAIGLFPLQFLGFNKEKALSGFKKALADKEMVCGLSAQLFASQERGETVFYSFQYSDRLNQWSLWLQQLWSESLGKAKKRNGDNADRVATLVPCRGASDQHSVLQQLIEGPGKKMACFHRVETSEQGRYKIKKASLSGDLMESRSLGELLKVEAEATENAVRGSGASTIVLSGKTLDEENVAYLMGVWMLSVGVLGELLDINAFDQPGVESGKEIARRVLSRSN